MPHFYMEVYYDLLSGDVIIFHTISAWMIQKYKSLNINSLKTRLCFTGKSYMFMRKVVRVFEKSRTCLKKFMYVFFYKMIGIQLYMFKSYNNSTLQSFVIKDIADIYRVSKKRLKCDSKRRWGTMKIYYHHSICTL